MEKQTNNDMTPNIGVNEAKPPKTKKSKDFLIIAVLAMLLVACGSEPTPTVTTEKEEITVEETTIEDTKPEDEEDVPEQVEEEVSEDTNTLETVSTDNLTIGSSIQYTVGKLTIMDVGISNNDYGTVLYMEVELENTSDEPINLTNNDFVVYIDDYQVTLEVGYRSMEEAATAPYIEVNPGRKAKYTFRVSLPGEYVNAGKIEFGFPGTQQTLFVKENGAYIWEQQSGEAEHDADGIIGEYTQVENPSITMSIFMDPSETSFILSVDFGDGRDTMMGFLDGGMIVDYFNEDLDGFYEYDENGFILNSCIDPDADGHYQK